MPSIHTTEGRTGDLTVDDFPELSDPVLSETEREPRRKRSKSAVPDEPGQEQEDFPPNPNEAAARVLVRRVLDNSPGLRELARRESACIVVEVPGPAWVSHVAEAWRQEVWATDDIPKDGDEIERAAAKVIGRFDRWCEYRRDGTAKSHRPEDGNVGVSAALSTGRPVYGFAPVPERHLPRDLLRAADRRVTIPPMDGTGIVETVALLTGQRPTAEFPEELARLVTLDDLWLACRPRQDADAYLARIRTLAEGKLETKVLTLDRLHGMDEAVAWGRALARDIDDYRRGKLPWASVDRGALLSGPPGPGQTTFARALAATCGLPLVSASLSQWQAAGHLGELLKAMRKSFEEARSMAPSILFVDEVDGFGDRASFKHDYRDYSIQVVNGFLEELDGIAGREGVVVIAACNDPERLDPAVKRSGRLDRLIHVPPPDRHALGRILRYHLGRDLEGVDLSPVTLLALGGTGADCERWVRGARRRARHARRDMVLEDLLAEIRGSRPLLSPETIRRCAIHEAGHALVTVLMRPGSLLQVSIRQTDASGGSVVSAVSEETLVLTRPQVEADLCRMLAGRAAEEVVLGRVSTGAGGDGTSDLARATCLAAAALCSLGLDEGGGALLWLGMPTAETVGPMLTARPDMARQVSAILSKAYAACSDLLRRNRDLLERIANLLVEKETVEGKEIEAMARDTLAAAEGARALPVVLEG